ncbi:MAG: DUF5674 family protein [Acidobacteriota bacterium]
MPIHLLHERATPSQLGEMLGEHRQMIKIVVDIRRGVLAGGGEMHADCESILLGDGSEQDDLWGANWYPADGRVEYESLINIRPRLGNRSPVVQSQQTRDVIDQTARRLLGGAQ